MEPYIRHIRINKVRHLHDIDIPVQDTSAPVEGSPVHVMLTGRNGAGKTSVLNAILQAMEFLISTPWRTEYSLQKDIKLWNTQLEKPLNSGERAQAEHYLKFSLDQLEQLQGAVSLDFESTQETAVKIKDKKVLLAYYAPNRQPNFTQPKVPAVPEVGPTPTATATRSKTFLEFLLNLKVQRSLSRDEGKLDLAQNIDDWFRDFVNMLKDVYEDNELRLDFNAATYRFTIVSKGTESPMDHLPDGYAAMLDIIADLILKMQASGTLVKAFEMPGIVLIDEIETHLHLELQKRVMPMLTRFFPKIQFIVTTHSPFVVSSIPNAVAVDLETGECLDDLDKYPYSSLAEGFFGVSQQSPFIQDQFDSLKKLAEQEVKSPSDEAEIHRLLQQFQQSSKMPNADLRAAIEQLKFKYNLR